MKLEVGKEYKTKGGLRAKVFRKCGDTFNVGCSDEDYSFLWCYSESGVCYGVPKRDIVSEWSDEVDLTKIEKPFGLLDKETQERLKNWKHGWEYYSSNNDWEYSSSPAWIRGT